jgi:hypothetical protein
MGLSSQSGELVLSVPSINSGEASFGRPNYKETRSVVCRVSTLDDEALDRNVDFLKIDVEGFECRVLRGASTTLERSRPLVLTEIAASNLSRADENPAILQAIMKGHGYVPFRLGLSQRPHKLKLEPVGSDLPDADYLWFPREMKGGAENFL